MAEKVGACGDIPFVAPTAPVTQLSSWERQYRRDFRDFDRLMRTSLFFDHLGMLARFCEQQGISFMLLNNAVHLLFLQMLPHGRVDYDRFVLRLREVVSDAHVSLCDPATGGIGAPELFQDTHHHNVQGSLWLTHQLAACLVEDRLLDARAGGR